jgi:hypothetical protein
MVFLMSSCDHAAVNKKTFAWAASVIVLGVFAVWFVASSRRIVPPPPPEVPEIYSNFDRFQDQLAERVWNRVDPHKTARDFRVVVSVGSATEGTILRPETTIPISYTDCAADTKATEENAPNLFPDYHLSKSVAVAAGLDQKALDGLAKVGASIDDSNGFTFSVANPRLRMLDENSIREVSRRGRCQSDIRRGAVWFVRGYVIGRRTFHLESKNLGALKGGISEIGNFSVKADPSASTVDLTDAQDEPFLQFVSTIEQNGAEANLPATTSHNASPTAATGKVYIQQDEKDSDSAGRRVAALLSYSGLRIPVAARVERIPSAKMPPTAQVRYFSDSDLVGAQQISAVLRSVYQNVAVVRIGSPAPKGQFEVWLARQKSNGGSEDTGPSLPTERRSNNESFTGAQTNAQPAPTLTAEPTGRASNVPNSRETSQPNKVKIVISGQRENDWLWLGDDKNQGYWLKSAAIHIDDQTFDVPWSGAPYHPVTSYFYKLLPLDSGEHNFGYSVELTYKQRDGTLHRAQDKVLSVSCTAKFEADNDLSLNPFLTVIGAKISQCLLVPSTEQLPQHVTH